MTKEQILWLMESNRDHVDKNSYLNCHAVGLHSIGIFSNKTTGLRIFIANHHHNLSDNTPHVGKVRPMSIGFHRHRRDIMLQHLHGDPITNIGASIDPEFEYGSVPLHIYHLPSSIVDGKGMAPKRLKKPVYANNIHIRPLTKEGIFMRSIQWHTVNLPSYRWSIWAVHEGAYAGSHDPLCATDKADLERGWDKDLYNPMSYETARNILNDAWDKCSYQR